jgi:hypothetical protein
VSQRIPQHLSQPSLRARKRALALSRARAFWRAAARALAFALALLVSIGAPVRSFALFRCAYTGQARTVCCCPAHEQMEGATLSQSCCCSVEQVDASLPAGTIAHDKLASFASAPPALPPAPPLSLRALRVADAPPALRPLRHALETRAGPPLIIMHRRLLL